MGVTTTKTNKPLNPRGNDQSPLAFNRAKLYSGKALDFDGVNDNVESANQITGLTTGLTFLGHVYIDSLSGLKRIFTQWDGSKGWFLISTTDKNAFFRTNTSNGNVDLITDTAPFKVGEWMHIACTYNGAQMAVYIDGQLIDTAAQTGSITTPTSEKFRVGLNENLGQPFDGKITGTKVFDVALTQAQILDLYNNPEKVVPTGVDNTALKLWLPMMEGAGTTAYDGSGNGNHGTISGATYVNGVGAPVAQSAVMNWNKGTNKINDSEFTASSTGVPNLFRGFVRNSTTEESPFGTFDAVKMTEDGTNSNPALVFQTTGSSSNPHTIKAYIKADSATSIAFATNGSTNPGNINVTTEWQAFEVTQSGANNNPHIGGFGSITQGSGIVLYVWHPQLQEASSAGPYVGTIGTAQTSPVLLPQGLTTGRDITGVNLFENVRKQGALNLDGNSWAEVHDNASLDITSAVSLEMWIYWEDQSAEKTILGKWVSGANRAYALIATTTTGEIDFRQRVSSSTYQLGISTLSSGWNHVVATHDHSANERIGYINGVQVSTSSSQGVSNESDNDVSIGGHSVAQYTNAIAQPRIYNRALTAEEVQRSYDSGKNIFTNS